MFEQRPTSHLGCLQMLFINHFVCKMEKKKRVRYSVSHMAQSLKLLPSPTDISQSISFSEGVETMYSGHINDAFIPSKLVVNPLQNQFFSTYHALLRWPKNWPQLVDINERNKIVTFKDLSSLLPTNDINLFLIYIICNMLYDILHMMQFINKLLIE